MIQKSTALATILLAILCILPFCGHCIELPNYKEVIVDVKQAKLFCRVMGKGQPIIIVHGGPGLSQDYLLPYMAQLANQNLVIFYDQRACGQSTGEITPETMQIATFVEDLDAVRQAFGYQQVSLLGHSWGGMLAMSYAIAHPTSVDKLILMNAGGASSEDFSLFIKEIMKRMEPYQAELKSIQESKSFAQGDPETVASYYRTLYSRYFYDPQKVNLLNLCMSPKAGLNSVKVFGTFRENVFMKPFNLHPGLRTLHIPALIIHGDSDPIPTIVAQNIHKSIADSKFILIKNCGHFPYIEQPAVLFKSVQEFLETNPNQYRS